MHRSSSRAHLLRAFLVAIACVALAAGVAACGSSNDSGSASAGTVAKGPAKDVTVALDWTPNTNHIGAYVADQLGYYKDAGLKVKFVPYASTAPETLVSRGKADFGFSYQAGIAYAHASGQDVRQVFSNIAKTQYAIGVRADNAKIASPKDLDGKTYAGFGTPDEGPELQWVIKKDGGTGKFKSVALNTSAYDAVYNGRADFTISVSTWDGIQAKLLKKPMRYFEFTKYGFPAQYSSAIASSDAYLKANPDTAKAFLAATQKGYEYAQKNPQQAAKLLIAANPQALKDPELVQQSAQILADQGYYKDAAGKIGPVDPKVWQSYGGFLYNSKLLAGKGGKPLTTPPDWSTYYTNDYLPSS
jgi:ABC-type nitrate/sulfonate/bicarbonate transport system substrate-binding protein